MNGETIKVLLVDGGSEDARVLGQKLAESGVAQFDLKGVRLDEEEFDPLDGAAPDVVLLNLSRFGNGQDALAEIRRRLPSVPVIVLATVDDENAALEAVREGAQDYLIKDRVDGRSLAHGLRYAIERQRAEEALEKSEAFYHSLVESLPQNIFRKDTQGRFTFGNGRFCNEMGRPPDEIVGKTDFDFFPEDLATKYRADDLRVMETGKPFEVVEEHVTPQGEKLYVQVIKSPVYDVSGKLIGTQGIFFDITEKFRAEEQLKAAYAQLAAKEEKLLATMAALRQSHEELIQAQLQLIQAEKMESVGRLAAGVAHEVKNPLAILLMGLDYLAEGANGPGDSAASEESNGDVLRAMREAVSRADLIVRGLVDFSANRQLDVKVMDLNSVIEQSLLLVKHELTTNHVSAVIEPGPAIPPVRIDANKMHQVFINLFLNATHAMPSGGMLTVRTYSKRLTGVERDEGSRLAERFRSGDTVVIAEVDDTGTGVPQDKLSKVWDPFFTTKPTGRGTGLGLTVTRKIVQLHHGSIELANRPEGGARVTLMFNAHVPSRGESAAGDALGDNEAQGRHSHEPDEAQAHSGH